MSGFENSEIKLPKILLVEGRDDEAFFMNYLEKLELSEKIQIFWIGGKDDFPNKIKTFVLRSNFKTVTSIAYIRDTDEELLPAFDSVKHHFLKAGLTPPEKLGSFSNSDIKVGIYFLPNNKDYGALEDLCLSVATYQEQFDCIQSFYDCLQIKSIKPRENYKSKSKVLSYLASMEEVVNTIGLGARKNYWDFNSTKLESLKTFLNTLGI